MYTAVGVATDVSIVTAQIAIVIMMNLQKKITVKIYAIFDVVYNYEIATFRAWVGNDLGRRQYLSTQVSRVAG